MSYTVKQLAEVSGVSVRTLHWYDEIGLLKPAFVGTNGYRYYEEEELLLLQQILFFRELGFKLDDIRRVLGASDFDRVKALRSHRRSLEKSLEQTTRLIETIDKTIAKMKGEVAMEDRELFMGFDPAKQEAYEQYLIKEKGVVAEDLIEESKRRTGRWNKSDWDGVKREGDVIYKALAECMQRGLEPASDEVQLLVAKHYIWIERFYTPTKEVYEGLGQLYCEHPDFRKFFAAFDDRLPEYMAEAMKEFARHNL